MRKPSFVRVVFFTIFILFPLLSHADDTILFYGTKAKKANVNFFSKCTMALKNDNTFQMTIFDFPLFINGERKTDIAVVQGRLGEVIVSDKVDGDEVVIRECYVDKPSPSACVMAITLKSDGYIQFEICDLTSEKSFMPRMGVSVSRKLE